MMVTGRKMARLVSHWNPDSLSQLSDLFVLRSDRVHRPIGNRLCQLSGGWLVEEITEVNRWAVLEDDSLEYSWNGPTDR